MSFYNCHMHVFSAECAPEHFLKIGGGWFLDNFSGPIKGFLETSVGRGIVNFLAKAPIRNGAGNVLVRYGAFASVGTMSTQKMVFENILQYYPPETRFVVLTLNMDHMGAGRSVLSYQGQIDQVIEIRKQYPDACLPFLSVDARMSSNANGILDFVKRYIGLGKPFVGVKLYPALGYFPYDERLSKVYDFCQEHGVPIMTHTDPGGSFFLGTLTAAMGNPKAISCNGYTPSPVSFLTKRNNIETEKFLEPHAWDVVLKCWPRLKVCFAHMGGSKALQKGPDCISNSTDRWYSDILSLMAAYEHIYTDISYTLHDKANWKPILNVLTGSMQPPQKPCWSDPRVAGGSGFASSIKDRLIFGTDYFMTEREKSERELAVEIGEWLLRESRKVPFRRGGREALEALTDLNPQAYLRSDFYNP